MGLAGAVLALVVGLVPDLAVAQPAGSATPTATAPQPTGVAPDEVDRHVARITDSEARELLIQKLKDDAAQRQAADRSESGFAGVLMMVRTNVQTLHDRHRAILDAVGDADADIHKSFQLLTDLQGWPVFWNGILVALAALAVGLGIELAIRLLLFRSGRAAVAPPVRPAGGRWPAAGMGILLDAIALAAFTFAAGATSLVFLERFDPMRELVVAVILVVLTTRAVAALAERILSPATPERRLLPLGDAEARQLKRQVTGVAAVVSFAAFSHALFRLIGVPEPLLQVHLLLFGLLITIYVAGAVLGRARELAAGRRSAWTSAAPGLAALIVVFAFFLWAGNTVLGRFDAGLSAVLAVIIVLALPVIERTMATIFFRLRADETADASAARLDPFLRFSLRGFLGLFAAVLLAEAGRFGIFAWFATPGGARVLRAAIDMGITLLLAAVLWEFVTVWIDRKLAEEHGNEQSAGAAADSEASRAATRAQTLLPLVKSFLFFVLVAVVAMIMLSSIGIDIGPLLAGAGVVGIAIGFGAQTLVRDIVSGVFFLIDDAFRIGEYIEMGDLRGEVERISLRSLTLRHHRGALHTIPFGELKSIANYSRDWAIYKMEFGIEYDSDINLVKKIIKKIGADLLADPEHGHRFIEPLKSQGIVAFADSALTVRVKFKCKPREQFVLRRVVLERIKQEFRDAGVQFAYPRVVVHAPAGVPAEAISAAAREAAERPLRDKAPDGA